MQNQNDVDAVHDLLDERQSFGELTPSQQSQAMAEAEWINYRFRVENGIEQEIDFFDMKVE